jgi:hypothetical protein
VTELANELLFRRNWWWDPIDMEFFKRLEQVAQQEVLAISLETQAQMLKTQAAGMEKISVALRGSKQSAR